MKENKKNMNNNTTQKINPSPHPSSYRVLKYKIEKALIR